MSYDKNCLMVATPMKNWKKWEKIIDKRDVHKPGSEKFGIEDEPHITILYGIEPTVPLRDLKSKVDLPPVNSLTYSIRELGTFQNGEYDVLKFGITSGALTEVNVMLRESLPYESDFPDYNPHMTIAYLKPGLSKKYIEKFNGQINKRLIPSHYIYSEAQGMKWSFKI